MIRQAIGVLATAFIGGGVVAYGLSGSPAPPKSYVVKANAGIFGVHGHYSEHTEPKMPDLRAASPSLTASPVAALTPTATPTTTSPTTTPTTPAPTTSAPKPTPTVAQVVKGWAVGSWQQVVAIDQRSVNLGVGRNGSGEMVVNTRGQTNCPITIPQGVDAWCQTQDTVEVTEAADGTNASVVVQSSTVYLVRYADNQTIGSAPGVSAGTTYTLSKTGPKSAHLSSVSAAFPYGVGLV
jgi:hypothetical protein